jgi:serine/threonine-protein kinase HipA
VLAFNADGHAKNLSLLHSDGKTRLAPIYDLVCTRAYERLARQLAMSVGGEAEPTALRREHWERLADSTGLGARYVIGAVQEMADRFPEATRSAAAEFRARYGEPALQMILPKIRRQAKRVARQLE